MLKIRTTEGNSLKRQVARGLPAVDKSAGAKQRPQRKVPPVVARH